VAVRNVHLVAPLFNIGPVNRAFPAGFTPKTFLLDFHAVGKGRDPIDIVFHRSRFPGHISVLLPKLQFAGGQESLSGFQVVRHNQLELAVESHIGRWLESAGELLERLGRNIERVGGELADEPILVERRQRKLRKIAALDRSRAFVADASPVPRISGLLLSPEMPITAAITLQAPPDSKPGDRFRFDIIQESGGKIVGGSTYIFAVTEDRKL
jgi:hypothetical protein